MNEQATNQPTPEEQADLQKRVEGFNGELIPLLGKYQLGLGAQAFITNDGRIGARPQVFNDKKKPDQTPPPAEGAAPTPTQPEPPKEAALSEG